MEGFGLADRLGAALRATGSREGLILRVSDPAYAGVAVEARVGEAPAVDLKAAAAPDAQGRLVREFLNGLGP